MSILFDLLFLFYIVLYLPILVLRGKWHGGFAERFGFLPAEKRKVLLLRRNIWVHAVSVGEVVAIDGLIRRLQREYPDKGIVLSVTTKTGHALAQKKYPQGLVILWAPLDLSLTVRAFVSAVDPVCYIAAETELWPNLFRQLDEKGVPVLVVNGRISDQAFPKYLWVKGLLKGTLRRVKLFCMQSMLDQERILALGARPESVRMVGNIKFDQVSSPAVSGGCAALTAEHQVLLAASTHPGEEDLLINAFLRFRSRYPRLRLVLAPRHPERAPAVARLVQKVGLQTVFFSKGPSPLASDEVLIVDTIGHLAGLYSAATVVVMGKSFTAQGGHNVIEPAVWGKAILVGPYMQNFRDITRAFLAEGAIVQSANPASLEQKVDELLADPQECRVLGDRAISVVERNRGATDRTMALIREALA